MPFISIIIPTHNNEEHIEQAISSCFDSEFDDIEVIVVNDASTDKTEEKIKNLKEQYPSKLKLITSESQIGPGPARNSGLEQSCGEYLMFLDGDDWFEHNAIYTVAKTLKAQAPDLLMFNHQRVWDNGIKVANIPNKYVELDLSDKDITQPEDRAGAIRNVYVPWNKAYKKEYITKEKLAFPKGYYEDIYWSIYSTIKSDKTYYTGKIIINYRQRTGSITRTNSIQHFNIFDQYSKVKKLLETNNEANKHYGLKIYESCKSQIFGIIRTGYRVPKKLERNFMLRAYKFLNEWRDELQITNLDLDILLLRVGYRPLFMLKQSRLHKIKSHAN